MRWPGEVAVERFAFLGEPRDRFFGAARRLAQRLELASAFRGEPPRRASAACLRAARARRALRPAVQYLTLIIVEIAVERPDRAAGDEPEPVGNQLEQVPVM